MKKIHRREARRYRMREQQAGRFWYFRESPAAISRDQCGHSRRACQRRWWTRIIQACDEHAADLERTVGGVA